MNGADILALEVLPAWTEASLMQATALQYIAPWGATGQQVYWALEPWIPPTNSKPRNPVKFIQNKMKSSWGPLFERHCCKLENHVIWPEHAAAEKQGPGRMHILFVSSVFLLTYMLNQCMKGDAQDRARHILKAFLKEFAGGRFNLLVDAAVADADKVSEIRSGVKVAVVDGRVDFCVLDDDEATAARLAEETGNRPAGQGAGVSVVGYCTRRCLSRWAIRLSSSIQSRRKQRLPAKLREELPLLDALLELHRVQSLHWLEHQVCQSLCSRIHLEMCIRGFPTQPAELDFTDRRAKDPVARASCLKRAWAARQARGKKKKQRPTESEPVNVKRRRTRDLRMASVAAKLWLSSKDKRKERSQYLLSSRAHFKGSRRVAVAFDATRAGGRKRSHYALMCLDTGITCWCPPQARFFHVLVLKF